nr:type II toxin-antitoxin system RelE/ParE family toxin [uncultured Halomonas sp.]
MAWKIELTRESQKMLRKIDPEATRRILRFLDERIRTCDDPRLYGKPLRGSELGDFWRYRVGDYLIVADIQDTTFKILVLRIGHRKNIYKQ